jgi:hypothetical protein
VTGSQQAPSSEVPSEASAVAVAVQGHYEAIGAGNFEEAYSYFGPTFRSQHDEASWIAGEQSYGIQSSTIHSLQVDEVLGTTATATVDVSFVDNTGTPRFVIVWSLLKEGGRWKLDDQISAQRGAEPQRYSSPTPTATPTASPSALPKPSGVGVPPIREENGPPSHVVKGNQSGIYYNVDSSYYDATTRRRASPLPRTRKRPATGRPSDERQRVSLAATTPIGTPTHTNSDEHGHQDLGKNTLICRYF